MRNAALFLVIVTAGLPQGRTAARSGAQAAAAQAVNGTGTLLANAPMFLFPDNKRTPLATLPAGTVVRVSGKEGDWYQVVYHDAFLGDRTGYIEAANIRVRCGGLSLGARSRYAWGARCGRAAENRAKTASAARQPAGAPAAVVVGARLRVAECHLPDHVERVYRRDDVYAERRNRQPDHDLRPGAAARARCRRDGASLAQPGRWRGRDLVVPDPRTADVSASIPHPFLFNAPRTVTGTVADVPRQEFALHMDAAWVVPAGRKTQIAIFGGPSYFSGQARTRDRRHHIVGVSL